MSPLRLVAPILVLACAGGSSPPAPGPPADAAAPDTASIEVPASPQLPPRGRAALEPWLTAGHYLTWRCEPAASPPRQGGTHGRHRICSNEALLGSASGPYPVGAASVKEVFLDDAGRPGGFAVGLKVEAGEGAQTWYWYERRGAVVVAEGLGVPDCAVCHGTAARDFVFFRAPP